MSSDPLSDKPWQSAPFRETGVGRPHIQVTHGENGEIYIVQPGELPPYPKRITEALLRYAQEKPDQLYLADRGKDGEWRTLTFGQALTYVRALGQFLIDHNISADAPVAILSGNSLEHALISLAATHVGVPTAPISPAYSLVATDYGRLKECVDIVTPGMIFVDNPEAFLPAIEGAVAKNIPILTTGNLLSDRFLSYQDAAQTTPTQQVDDAFALVNEDTIAKFLFTSGSTGMPKAVINTHKMICSNAAMTREAMPFFKDEGPLLLDWAPWHHTAGGNKVFYIALFNGGTLYVDDGRPTPKELHKTVRNIKDVSPTWYFNVPKGFEALVGIMNQDKELCQAFFKNLKMLWYAGAAMAQHTWDDLERLAVETTGQQVVIGTGLGATETAPGAVYCTWPQNIAGNIGVPTSGSVLKLVPMDGKFDARVKGPHVTPGYWRQDELTKKAFDEEGFYKFGDALKPADPDDYSQGFLFDGRTAENFKLDTGTWVATGALRLQFINHFGDAVADVTITGADESFLGALVFPNYPVLRKMANMPDADINEVLGAEPVREYFAKKLTSLAEKSTGSSTLIRKLLLLDTPASLEKNELTDKGSINQRAVLNNRPELVKEIYSDSPRLIEIIR